MFSQRLFKTMKICLLLLIPCRCFASADLEIWPVTVSWSTQNRTPTVWLRNVGKNSVSLQIRLLKWSQRNNQNIYSDQDQAYAIPTFINLQSRQELPIRIYGEKTSGSIEQAYRIVIDQLPELNIAPHQQQNAIDIRMQYILPFFVYEQEMSSKLLPDINGFPREKHHIHWSLNANGLAIKNLSQTHMKITSITLLCSGVTCFQQSTPVSYVLPGADITLPLSIPATQRNKATELIINNSQPGKERFRKE